MESTLIHPTAQPIGLSIYRNLSAGTTGTVAKASPGQLYGYYIANAADANRYLKIYDKATTPLFTDTPVATILLPPLAAANALTDVGIAFAAGISLRATTGVADIDTGAPSANDVIVNLYYA